MALADLTRLIAPPHVPNQVGTVAEWQKVEGELGLTFPSDFREFVGAYGTGLLGRFYSVWNPFWGIEFVEHVRLICGYERASREQLPQFYPYLIYPESPGFLPWGSDENGNYYGWLTEGEPDCWPVLTNNVRGRGYQMHHCSMTNYLAGVFQKSINPLASDYPLPDDLRFDN